MTGAYVVDDQPAGTSIAAMDLAAGARLYRAALDLVGATALGAR